MFNVKDLITATKGVLTSGVAHKNFYGISIDSRMIREGEIFLVIVGKKFDGHNFIDIAIKQGAKAVIYSDAQKVGVFKRDIVYVKVEDTMIALGGLARYHRRRFDIPVIAVTGSSGKTTTKEMVSWVLSAKYNVLKNKGTQNNLIGVPLTLFNIHSKHDICVIEMGTNRFGEIKQLSAIAEPNVGVITNIGPSHLEFLENLKGVYKEKIELIKQLKPPGIAILNKADLLLTKLSRIKSTPIFFFGVNRECEFEATEITYKPGGIEFLFNKTHRLEIKHCALHNVSNALAAIGCGLMFGLDLEQIKERIESFDSPDMRLKEIKLKNCIVFDDSYNSNPQSLKHAIDVLCRQGTANRRVLIMGDMLELGKKADDFHSYFGQYVSKKPVDVLVTFGNFSKVTAESAKKSGMNSAVIFHFEKQQDILDFLSSNVQDGDVFLVKGSRSMQMEKIVAFFKERF